VPDNVIEPALLPTEELEVITTAPDATEAEELLFTNVPPSKRIGFEMVCPFKSRLPPELTRMAFDEPMDDAFERRIQVRGATKMNPVMGG